MTTLQLMGGTALDRLYSPTPSPELSSHPEDYPTSTISQVPEKPPSPGMDWNLADSEKCLDIPECNFRKDSHLKSYPSPGMLKVRSLESLNTGLNRH